MFKRKRGKINENEKNKKVEEHSLSIEEYTKGLDFPVSKRELLEITKQRDVSKSIKILFQEKYYKSLTDVIAEEKRLRDLLMNLNIKITP